MTQVPESDATKGAACQTCGVLLVDTVADQNCPTCLFRLSRFGAPSPSNATKSILTPDELSSRLPDVDVIEFIDRGGMGAVYRGRQPHLDREVAVKVLMEDAAEHAVSAERFMREARALAKLHHPNIVTAFDAGEVDGQAFLVMQYVEGCDLKSLVEQSGPVDVEQAVEWTIQAARGLEYAHREGIIHRDVKPANLLVDEQSVLRILDLGLARIEEGDTSGIEHQLTGSGFVVGTVDFMAPEQALDTHSSDARSDIYSLGCTLYYLLTGKAMFRGDTAIQRIVAHREQDRPSISRELPPQFATLEDIYQKMVVTTPEARQQTMAQVIQELESVLSHARLQPSSAAASGAGTYRDPAETDESLMETVALAPADGISTQTDIGRLESPQGEPSTDKSLLKRVVTLGVSVLFVLLSLMVYRIETDYGELVVQIDPEHAADIDILLREQGLDVIDQSGNRRWSIQPGTNQRLDSGNWRIRQQPALKLAVRNDDGIELDPERFIVRRNDRIILDISMDRSASETRKPPVVVTPASSLTDKAPHPGPQFQRFEQPISPGHTTEAAFADLDNDGDQDVVIASYSKAPDQVWMNDGYGRFSPGMTLSSQQSTGVELADLNGDGHLDAFFTSRHVANSIWLGDGTGAFTRTDQTPGKGICRDVALADFDGDGDLDAALAFGGAGALQSNRILLNDGSGNFADSQQELGRSASWSVAAGDLDADGDNDLVFAEGDFRDQPEGWQPNSVWLNDGKGRFAELEQSFSNSQCFKVSLGDLDDDGDLDAAFAGFDRRPAIWMNDGTGLFTQSTLRPPIEYWCASAIDDLDNDDDLDVVFAAKNGKILLLLNNGDGTFEESWDLTAEPGMETGLALADVDGDQDVDLYVGFGQKPDSIWFNQIRSNEMPKRFPLSPDLPKDLLTPLSVNDVAITIHDPAWQLQAAYQTPTGIHCSFFDPETEQLYAGFGSVTGPRGERLKGGLFRVTSDGSIDEILRDSVFNPVLTPDRQRIFYEPGYRGHVAEWDLASRRLVRKTDLSPEDDGPTSPRFPPPWYSGDLIARDQYLFADFGGDHSAGGIWKWGSRLSTPERLHQPDTPAPDGRVWALTFATDQVVAYVARDCDSETCGQLCTFDGTRMLPIPGLPFLPRPGSVQFDPHSGDVLLSYYLKAQVDRLSLTSADGNSPEPQPFITGFDKLRAGTLRLSRDQQYLTVTDSDRVYVFAKACHPD